MLFAIQMKFSVLRICIVSRGGGESFLKILNDQVIQFSDDRMVMFLFWQFNQQVCQLF